jgi:hypothetical protein
MLPLVFNQERHLIAEEALSQTGFVPTGARVPLVFRIDKAIDRERLGRAINVIVRRHAALRNTYGPNDQYSPDDRLVHIRFFARTELFVPGLYVQRVVPGPRVSVADRQVANDEELADLIREELLTPFDTVSGPPIRVTRVSVGAHATLLVVVLTHHTVDGWSFRIFGRELATLLAESGATLPEVPVQYHDFAIWQLRQVRTDQFQAEERYWHQHWAQLGDAQIGFDDLPFADAEERTTAPFSIKVRVPMAIDDTHYLRTRLSALGLTPYVLFRTAMTIALHHYSRKRRLAFWANFTNRRHPEFMPGLGWYSNTHIVTVEIATGMTCMSLCQRVAKAVADAQAHEALPLPALWQRLGRTLDTNRMRVNFDLLPAARPSTAAVHVEPTASPVSPRGLDLDIRLRPGDEFALVATFNPNRYTSAGVTAMLWNIRNIAMAVAAAPALRVADCERLMAAAARVDAA